jgi:hypothetical protein
MRSLILVRFIEALRIARKARLIDVDIQAVSKEQ